MRQLLLTVAAVTTLGLSSPAAAQGVPTFDGSQLGQLVAELEDMCDRGYRLVLLAERRHRKGRELPPETEMHVQQFSEAVIRFVGFTAECIPRGASAPDLESAYQLENFIDDLRKKLRKESIKRMQLNGDVVKAEILYVDILNNMEAIGNHSLNVIQVMRN